MPTRPPFSGDGTRPIPRPPDRNTASAYEYVTGRSKPAALSGRRQPRGDPMASSRFRLRLSRKGPPTAVSGRSRRGPSGAPPPCRLRRGAGEVVMELDEVVGGGDEAPFAA